MEYCPRQGCYKAGPDLGDCAEQTIGCPPPREVEPGKHIVIRCTKCDITLAIPVAELMKGNALPSCKGDVQECLAVTLAPAASTKKLKP